jgi:hypothetical protein
VPEHIHRVTGMLWSLARQRQMRRLLGAKASVWLQNIRNVKIGTNLIYGIYLMPRGQTMIPVPFRSIRADDPDLLRDLEFHQVSYTGQQETQDR